MTKYMLFHFANRLPTTDYRKKAVVSNSPRFASKAGQKAVSKPAFTLVELLIVITIISILSAIGFATFQSAQKKGRDAQRKNDLTQIKRALIAARNDCTGGYFPKGTIDKTDTATETVQFTQLMAYLTDTNLNYLKGTLTDPRDGATYYYGYKTNSSADASAPATNAVCPISSVSDPTLHSGTTNFVLRAKLEIAQDPDIASTYHKCLDDTSPSTNPITTIVWGTDPAPNATDGFYYVCSK